MITGDFQRQPALRNGAPFKDWELPPAIRRVQRKLGKVPNGDRQMVQILSMIPGFFFFFLFFWLMLAWVF